MNVQLRVDGADRVARGFTVAAATVDARAAATAAKHGQMLLARIRTRASGRPGPRVQTGNYRRSWVMTPGLTAGSASVVVSTGAPQANRLEYGFVGADSLGRVYNQPPFPHVGPAVQETEGPFVQDVARLAVEVAGG